ncbi:spore germination protein [Paenibacillus sp. YYML68]|uniref:spore germination protein n=1 Tax=Paenibacillus sp. YYML68 TaxID=2909250 RepID=UPI002492F68C|nr:spore germination protein [Paenibacillus sp. YYML68]
MAKHKMISAQLAFNKKKLEELFADCADLTLKSWRFGSDMSCSAISAGFETLAPKNQPNYMKETLKSLIPHELGPAEDVTVEELIRFYEHSGVSERTVEVLDSFDTAVEHILKGSLVIFVDGWKAAISYDANSMENRSISEPINEPSVSGPREGTVENLETNIGLLRSRLKNSDFKLVRHKAGDATKVMVAYGYLKGTVQPDVLAEFQARLKKALDYEITDPSYIEELLEDSTYSPFPQFRYTERPDAAVAALLDGKIIVMTEGSPSILIAPGLFVEFLTTSEDYYQRTIHASLVRLLRIVAFYIALMLPSTYIAFSTFHPELLPTVLMLAILDAREGIPFPAIVEALVMEFFFELLREAGIRLPKPIGSAVSIVGALVIGQAAIEAKIASPIMVIVVAATGIASFALPQYNLAVTLRILRFPLMILSAMLGGFGLMIGSLLILLHLTCLCSLGQPYLTGMAPLELRQFRDVFIRYPLKLLLRSPRNRNVRRYASRYSEEGPT